jgi:hypothetical protein
LASDAAQLFTAAAAAHPQFDARAQASAIGNLIRAVAAAARDLAGGELAAAGGEIVNSGTARPADSGVESGEERRGTQA